MQDTSWDVRSRRGGAAIPISCNDLLNGQNPTEESKQITSPDLHLERADNTELQEGCRTAVSNSDSGKI